MDLSTPHISQEKVPAHKILSICWSVNIRNSGYQPASMWGRRLDLPSPACLLRKKSQFAKISQRLFLIQTISQVIPVMSQNTKKSDQAAHDVSAPADSKIDHAASIRYWSSLPSTASNMLGMLGTYPWYTRIELQGSKNFLNKVRRLLPALQSEGKFNLGVDCGAGVGRVTEGFLRHVCTVVDAVEPVQKFTQVLQEGQLKKDGVIGDIYTLGLEDWYPEKKYDLIWTQWCVGHLTDVQLVQYVSRCRNSLTENGIMVIKENLSTHPGDQDMYDDEDSSVTRTDAKFKKIFDEAGMEVIKSEIQTGFPKQFKLLPVKSYALRPKN